MFTIEQRPLTAEQRTRLRARARFSVNDDLGGAITFLLAASALGFAAARLLDSTAVGLIVLALGLVLAAANLRSRLAAKARLRADLAGGTTEVIRCDGPIVVTQEPGGSEGPSLLLALDDRRVLVLVGPWLFSAALYSADEQSHVEEHINLQPQPYAFPSTSFELLRLRRSGEVLGIRPLGEYCQPVRMLPPGTVDFSVFTDCEIVDRSHPALTGVSWRT